MFNNFHLFGALKNALLSKKLETADPSIEILAT